MDGWMDKIRRIGKESGRRKADDKGRGRVGIEKEVKLNYLSFITHIIPITKTVFFLLRTIAKDPPFLNKNDEEKLKSHLHFKQSRLLQHLIIDEFQ